MANQDWGFGLQALRGPFDSTPETIHLPLKADYATAIYKGELLIWVNTGYVVGGTTNSTADVVGVAAEYYAGSATTKTDLAIWTDRNEFVVQSDGGTTSSNRASYLMNNAALTTNVSGSTITGLANGELDFSSMELTTATNPLKVMGFQLCPGETSAAANVKCVVKLIPGIGVFHGATQ